ncbi:hypothetical protein RJ639_000294 [Escallonia herrerae]|uniref:Ubiquitin-like protease family profile domain-containing protein n=1 Tax=Escallonia herrerae TaxID=1293975 RepID=A0AA88X8C6_9ASTE|nr:hypothetical protein RJ639_000294 [Escallonia herrerae]
MEGENKRKKGGIPLDFQLLLPSTDAGPEPQLVVVPSAAAAGAAEEPLSAADAEPEPHGEETCMSDETLDFKIRRFRNLVGSTMPSNLPDRGNKLRATLKRYEAEMERRRLRGIAKGNDGCEKPKQSHSSSSVGASNGLSGGAPVSKFGSRLWMKLDEDQRDSRTVSAFENEISCLAPCKKNRRRTKLNGQFSPRGRHKTSVSSRQAPFQCPSTLSVDVDKQSLPNGDQKGKHSSTSSPRHFGGNLSDSFSTRNASQSQHSHRLRPRNGQTLVLVDEEEPQLIETNEQADKVDDCMKDIMVYYPSREDPESVEICYSDLKCLAPEGYLSSTIMNFYIRYLQQPRPPRDRARCDYHFFNTYFYKKLKEAVLKERGDNEALFVKFRRWWKGVNIFEKAYIFLPIHEQLHWSLVIICIPDKEDESGPIVLHLDSLGYHSSRSVFDSVKSFLKEEWNYLNNQGEAPFELPIANKIWKNLPRRIDEKKIMVPQQKNEYDCGLFVLFFMERFIEDAPERLKKMGLDMFGKQWFKPEEASDLRRKIRDILMIKFKSASENRSASDP